MSEVEAGRAALLEVLNSPIKLDDKVLRILRRYYEPKAGERLPTTWTDRERRIQANMPHWNDSLKWAALVWEKDQRTIRRWCEKKVFKHAYRTKGGHWRIPYLQVREVDMNRLVKCHRHHKSILRSKAARYFAGVIDHLRLIVGESLLLDEIAAQIAGSTAKDHGGQKKRVSDDALVLCASRLKEIRIEARARKRNLDAGSVTASTLAEALGVSRATLYRTYGKKQIRAAIQKASVKFEVNERVEQDRSLAQEVESVFEDAARLHEDREYEVSTVNHSWPSSTKDG